MVDHLPKQKHSSKKTENNRVKVKQRKKTVGITLPKNLIQKARKHKLNISRTSSNQHNRLLGSSKSNKV